MGKNIKKLGFLQVLAMMIITFGIIAMPQKSFADTPISDFEYEINNSEVTITKYIGPSCEEEVYIPSEIEGYKVTAIGDEAFQFKNLSKIVMPNTIETIGESAFAEIQVYTTGLLEIPSSVKKIGKNAFSNTPLGDIKIPYGVEVIEQGTFSYSRLSSIEIPDSVTTIGDYAFQFANFSSIEIPESVTSIGDGVFTGSSLKSIKIPKSIKNLPSDLFDYCKELENVELPNTLESIGYGTFNDCESLKNIEIPNSVTNIGQRAFYNSGLESITIPNSMKSIGVSAFSNAKNLKEVNFHDNITSIKGYAFYECNSLTNVELPKNLKTIGKSAFRGTSLKHVRIPDGVTTIEEMAFYYYDDKMESIIIPSSVTNITGSIINENTTIYGELNSYVDNYAKKKGYKFNISSPVGKVSSYAYNKNKFTWKSVSGADGYEVYRATSSKGKYSLRKTVEKGGSLSYINTGLTTGKTYYYKVRAYKYVDGQKFYSDDSTVVSAAPKLSTPKLTLKAGTKKTYLKWDKVSGASGYEIYRSTSKTGTYSKNKTITSGSTTSYTNTGLTSKKGYYFKVRSYKVVNGKKVYSSYSSVRYIKVK